MNSKFLSSTSYQLKYSINVTNVNKIIYLSNGLIAAAIKDNSIHLYNNTNSTPITILLGHKGLIFGLTQLKSGILASGSFDSTIKLWDLSLGNYTYSFKAANFVFSVVELSNGLLAAGLYNGTIQFFNLTTSQVDLTINYHKASIFSIIQLTDGRIASADTSGILNIWSQTLLTKVSLIGNVSSISVLFELNNGLVAAATGNYIIQIWNISTNALANTFAGHSNAVTSLIQLKNGLLASGSIDKTIKIWNVDTGEMLATNNQTGNIFSVIENDAQSLISCTSDGKINTWCKLYLQKFLFGFF